MCTWSNTHEQGKLFFSAAANGDELVVGHDHMASLCSDHGPNMLQVQKIAFVDTEEAVTVQPGFEIFEMLADQVSGAKGLDPGVLAVRFTINYLIRFHEDMAVGRWQCHLTENKFSRRSGWCGPGYRWAA